VQALLPMIVFAIGWTGIFTTTTNDAAATMYGAADSPTGSDKPSATPTTYALRSKTPLVILTASAVVAVYTSSGSNTVLALGLSYATLFAVALLLVERASSAATQNGGVGGGGGGSVVYSANGFLVQPDKPSLSARDTTISVIRDVSAAAAVGTGVAALIMENFSFGGLAYWGLLGQAMGDHWVFRQAILSVAYGVGMVAVHMVAVGAMLVMVSGLRLPVQDLAQRSACGSHVRYAIPWQYSRVTQQMCCGRWC